MQSLECRAIAVSGFCSTGKSELARQMGSILKQTDAFNPIVVHMGDMFRFCHDFGVKIGEGPNAIEESALLALEQVRLVVNPITGEMNLEPKNGKEFRQTDKNGVGASSLGSNGDFALFAQDFVWDAVAKLEQSDTVLIIDGREQMLPWFTPDAASQALLVRTHVALPIRTALYRQERPEAIGYMDEHIHEILFHRDQQDGSILEPTLAQIRHVIEVERTNPSIEATTRVATQVTDIIFQHFEGKSPDGFDRQPVYIQDTI